MTDAQARALSTRPASEPAERAGDGDDGAEAKPFEPWVMAAAAALAHLESSSHGLTDAQARSRLTHFGPNKLREKPRRPVWLKFIDQFKNLLVLVLIAAAALAAAIGDIKDAVVILVVVVLNAGLGFYQEHRAEATLAALKHMLARHARVRRGDEVVQLDAQALVPGDIVLLEAGESHAVGKHAGSLSPGEHALAERLNMVYMNTVVTRGRVEAVVCATGMHTEMGRISGLLEAAPEQPTPLQIQIDALGKSLAGIAGVVVTLIFGLGLLRGDELTQTIMTSIALAVAAIPEGLPAVVTVTLAIGMHRLWGLGAGSADAVHGDPYLVDRAHHGRPARSDAGPGAFAARHHERAAAPQRCTHPDAAAPWSPDGLRPRPSSTRSR